jgi:hypothetical protein
MRRLLELRWYARKTSFHHCGVARLSQDIEICDQVSRTLLDNAGDPLGAGNVVCRHSNQHSVRLHRALSPNDQSPQEIAQQVEATSKWLSEGEARAIDLLEKFPSKLRIVRQLRYSLVIPKNVNNRSQVRPRESYLHEKLAQKQPTLTVLLVSITLCDPKLMIDQALIGLVCGLRDAIRLHCQVSHRACADGRNDHARHGDQQGCERHKNRNPLGNISPIGREHAARFNHLGQSPMPDVVESCLRRHRDAMGLTA